MALINLHEFIENTIAEFDVNYFSQDKKLPEAFKTYVKANVGGEKFSFLDYTTIVRTELSIYCPNQWFYIAAYYCKLYPILKQYKDLVYSSAELPESPKDYQKFFADLSGDKEKSLGILTKGELEDGDKDLLATFISDSQWWRGGKGIERNDFYYSPILSAAALVNQSQSYVAEICKYLVDNPTAWEILLGEIQGKSVVIETSTIFESKVLVAFMEECMRVFLQHDPNLSKVSFKENKVTIGFKGCPIGKILSEFEKVTDDRRKDDCNKDIQWEYNNEVYCYRKEQSKDSFDVFKANFNSIYRDKYEIIDDGTTYKLVEHSTVNSVVKATKRPAGYQVIYYGAPGTGKSHKVDENYTRGYKSFRITFHPDTDYASFVGCYKPTMKPSATNPNEEEIAYAFCPQVFVNAYVHAWNNPSEPTYLIIEELNRGNCAQIFGDVFQLLDRNTNTYVGFSKYYINADADIADYLSKHINNDSNRYADTLQKIYGLSSFDFSVMGLPDNLYILATMNTSDQSLFPIDSAFKRRWEMEYVPVNYTDAKQFTVKLDDGHLYNWADVLIGLNTFIKKETSSTNKILGNRFAQPKTGNVIDSVTFRDKVLFFLFNDVFKDNEDFSQAFFEGHDELSFFEDLCESSDNKTIIRFVEAICGAKNLVQTEVTPEVPEEPEA